MEHDTIAFDAWTARAGDDVRELREDIVAGEVDFSLLEMS